MDNTNPPNSLIQLIADLFIHSQNLYSLHWNLISTQFLAIHQWSDDEHAAVLKRLDRLAERVRALGYVIPTHLSCLERYRRIPEIQVATDIEMLQSFLSVTRVLLQHVHISIQEVGATGDLGTQDILVKIDQTLANQIWMLRSTLGDLEIPMGESDART